MTQLAGFAGTLVSRAYAETLLLAETALHERRAIAALPPWWRAVRARCGPASSTRVLCRCGSGAARLAARVQVAAGAAAERRHVDGGARGRRGVGSDRPHRLGRVARRGVARLGARTAWRCTRAGACSSTARTCACSTPAARSRAGTSTSTSRPPLIREATARLLVMLASAASLRPAATHEPDGASLDAIVAASDAHGQSRVHGAARTASTSAIEHLLAALLDSRGGRRGRRAPPLESLYEQALTAVYRILFLCFAEARGLVPAWHPVYRDAYTMESLRTAAGRRDAPRGLWEAFQAISRLAHHGCEAGDLRVTAFNGRLFAPARAPLLERAALPGQPTCATWCSRCRRRQSAGGTARARVVSRPGRRGARGRLRGPARLRASARGRPTGRAGRRRRQPSFSPGARSRVARRPARSIRRGRSRAFSSAQALEPLVRDAGPERILALRIVDPGDGQRRVSRGRVPLPRAGVRGGADPGRATATKRTSRRADRAGFRRLVAQRCLFGVDLNPMAVHLARLSLWLTTLAAEKPLTFLDHHLLAGDSLVGASPVRRRAPATRAQARAARATNGSSRCSTRPCSRTRPRGVRAVRHEMEQTLDDTAAIVRAEGAGARRACARPARCSRGRRSRISGAPAWFGGPTACPRGVFHALVDHVLTGRSALPDGHRGTTICPTSAASPSNAGSFTGRSSFRRCSSGQTDASTRTAASTR